MGEGESQDSVLHIPERSQEGPGIVAISVPFPGVSRVFEEGEKLGLWRFVQMERGDSLRIPDGRAYILGAWLPAYQGLLGAEKTGVLWTSSAGEMEMEPVEIQYLRGILQDPRIGFIWFGDPSLTKVYPQKGFYAPYPLSPDLEIPQVEKRHAVALFNPGGLKKNNLNQLLAVALAQREDPELVLETNLGGHQQIMDRLGIRYHLHPWLPREQYHRLLASCDVNLAVSWAETFNYQVAEAGLLGVPSVISRAVTLPGFRVLNPNDPQGIAERISHALRHQGSMDIRQRILGVARRNNQALASVLNAKV